MDREVEELIAPKETVPVLAEPNAEERSLNEMKERFKEKGAEKEKKRKAKELGRDPLDFIDVPVELKKSKKAKKQKE